MSQLEITVQINKPIEAVFDYLADLRHMPQWSQGMVEARLMSGQPGVEGAVYNCLIEVGGRRVNMPLRITGGERPNFYTSLSHFGPFAVGDRWVFSTVGGGTQVHQTTSITAEGQLDMLSALVATYLYRRQRNDLYRAKKRLDSAPLK